MKVSKKLERQIRQAINCLEEATTKLNQSSGWAMPIDENRAVGSDYKLINPRCSETSANTPEYIRKFEYVGSDVIKIWTALALLKGILNDKQVPDSN